MGIIVLPALAPAADTLGEPEERGGTPTSRQAGPPAITQGEGEMVTDKNGISREIYLDLLSPVCSLRYTILLRVPGTSARDCCLALDFDGDTECEFTVDWMEC